jgi:hypothetical protein
MLNDEIIIKTINLKKIYKVKKYNNKKRNRFDRKKTKKMLKLQKPSKLKKKVIKGLRIKSNR